MDSCSDTLAGGLPHSEIHGSTPARGSPWLFAACHVLHRLLVPRHPPNALLSLEILVPGITGSRPMTRPGEHSTMHRNHPQDPRVEPEGRRLLPIAESFSLSTQQSPLNTHPIAEHPKAFGQTLSSGYEYPKTTMEAPRDAPEPDSP